MLSVPAILGSAASRGRIPPPEDTVGLLLNFILHPPPDQLTIDQQTRRTFILAGITDPNHQGEVGL